MMPHETMAKHHIAVWQAATLPYGDSPQSPMADRHTVMWHFATKPRPTVQQVRLVHRHFPRCLRQLVQDAGNRTSEALSH